MSALLADLARRTAQERAEKPHMSERDRFRWRRDRVELVIAELEPVIAIEEKYPHGGLDAAQVHERRPKRMKTAKDHYGRGSYLDQDQGDEPQSKSVPRLEWVGDALTAILGNMIVVLCRGV